VVGNIGETHGAGAKTCQGPEASGGASDCSIRFHVEDGGDEGANVLDVDGLGMQIDDGCTLMG
jgi:hypothetical protein